MQSINIDVQVIGPTECIVKTYLCEYIVTEAGKGSLFEGQYIIERNGIIVHAAESFACALGRAVIIAAE